MCFCRISKELFYFLLLPPIIFEAGYTLRKKDFFHNILSIVMFAVLGTLVSTFIIGYLTYLAGKLVRAWSMSHQRVGILFCRVGGVGRAASADDGCCGRSLWTAVLRCTASSDGK